MTGLEWWTRDLYTRVRKWRRQGANRVKVEGRVTWWTDGPDGERVDPQTFSNGVTYQGLNYALEAMFRSGAVSATWYAGLINAAAYSGVAVGDTMASHGGWAEFTSYSASNRPAWGPDAAASGAMANTTPFTYTITSDATLAGMFITNTAAKSPGNTGVLWATALQTRSINNGDTLSGLYSITITPSS